MERESAISKSAISKHETIVKPFLKEAFKEGTHRIRPPRVSEPQWLRRIMIGVVYNDIGSSATLQELADENGVSRQRIGQINDDFLKNLHNSCSPELQGRYFLDELLTARKPWSQKSKDKASESQKIVSLKIKAQIEAGVTDREKISNNTGISRSIIRGLARTTLRGWGISC